MVMRNDHPKLAQEAAIVMPKDMQLPNNDMPTFGRPSDQRGGPGFRMEPGRWLVWAQVRAEA